MVFALAGILGLGSRWVEIERVSAWRLVVRSAGVELGGYQDGLACTGVTPFYGKLISFNGG